MSTLPFTLLVVAKAPVAGFAKTRLTPPLSPSQAAELAAASLLDTLTAAAASAAAHLVLAWTGDLDRAQSRTDIALAAKDFEVVEQCGNGFGERLANAHAAAARTGLPVLQIGMDTPQAGPELLTECGARLLGASGAVLGPATDGGWWALGVHDPRAARVLADVPMSTARTGDLTRESLQRNGYQVEPLIELEDVDHYDDIARVAGTCGGGRFGAAAVRFGAADVPASR
ncbi:MAG: DUF2064 domain-containing protein [Nocardia sp.]|nr:DUF2064 domain-containing protein [Nocardia sp.]